MKNLILIIGPNGVGKTTTAKALLEHINRSAYIDADWCRAINPFIFTTETQKTVTENLFCLIRNYLMCPDIDTVIFPYSFHGGRKDIFESVLRRVDEMKIEYELVTVLLTCSLEENIIRAKEDGRDETRIERGIRNTFNFYNDYNCFKIDSTKLSISQVVNKIIARDVT